MGSGISVISGYMVWRTSINLLGLPRRSAIRYAQTSHPIEILSSDSPKFEKGDTYGDGGKEYTRPREIVLVVQTLPNGILSANPVCVDSNLC